MSKGLSSFPEERRTAIATRRLNNGINGNRGNGFWGAKDYFTKKGMRLPGKLGTEQTLMEALRSMQDGGSFSTEAPRDRRHPGDGNAKGNGFGKPARRKDGAAPSRSKRRGDSDGVGMYPMRDKFPAVARGRKTFTRSHTNKPRVVGSAR